MAASEVTCVASGESVRRDATTADSPEDSAQHTLQKCLAWATQRRVLAAVVSNDLLLPAVATILRNVEGLPQILRECPHAKGRE